MCLLLRPRRPLHASVCMLGRDFRELPGNPTDDMKARFAPHTAVDVSSHLPLGSHTKPLRQCTTQSATRLGANAKWCASKACAWTTKTLHALTGACRIIFNSHARLDLRIRLTAAHKRAYRTPCLRANSIRDKSSPAKKKVAIVPTRRDMTPPWRDM